MATNFSVKIGKIGLFTFICRPGIRKQITISLFWSSGFKRSIYDDLATSGKHVVNYGPVTSAFKRVKGVHHSSISSLATFALLLDFAGISTEFSGAITTQLCFTYTL